VSLNATKRASAGSTTAVLAGIASNDARKRASLARASARAACTTAAWRACSVTSRVMTMPANTRPSSSATGTAFPS
jgi:hypothetical protein